MRMAAARRGLLLAVVTLYLAQCVGFAPAGPFVPFRTGMGSSAGRTAALPPSRVRACSLSLGNGRGGRVLRGVLGVGMAQKKKGPKARADVLLVEQGLAVSEKEALSLILGREVCDTQRPEPAAPNISSF